MREARSRELSERQQILLSSYVDNECSLFSRLLAERLIKTNNEARLFVHTLKNTSQAYRASVSEHDTSIDLWDRISNRLESEERAALYLGQRKPTVDSQGPSLMEKLLSRQALIGGLSGAAVAATVLVFISRPSRPGEILPVYTGGPVAAHNSPAFHQASLGADTQALGSSPMEVDWMRGNGSFKIIQNPKDNSAIIWVRKRSYAAPLGNQTVKATPTIRVLNEQGLDVTPPRTAK